MNKICLYQFYISILQTYKNWTLTMYMNDDTNHVIKNLVISGGGAAGISFYGALKQSNQNNMWKLENIENIYATSVGSALSVIISLQYQWNELDHFIIKRPWHKVFKFDLSSIFNAIENRGIFNVSTMVDILKPILLGKDIDTDVTMKQFFDITNINMHFMCVELKTMNVVNISHKTHPDWKLIDAVYCSCALPICFAPYMYNNDYLCDGGFKANYPLNICMDDNNLPEETLGIGLKVLLNKQNTVTEEEKEEKEEEDIQQTLESFNLFDYIITILLNLIRSINSHKNNNSLCKEILFDANFYLFNKMYDAINEQEIRIKLLEFGMETANSVIQHST